MTVTIKNLARLEAKIAKLPGLLRTNVKDAFEQNALEFMSQIARIVPVEHGALVGTLEKIPGKTSLGVGVAIGGPAAPYPAHLEFGHIDARSGAHVHAVPFWFSSLRVLKNRFQGRISRATSKAIKALIAGVSSA